MRHVLTIAARDLRERSFVFVTAIVLAILPFAVAFARGGVDRRTILLIAGFITSVNFTIGLALVVGATMIGRELSERRLSFYFAKPIPAPAIWLGKVAGALVTVALAFAIGAIPTYFAGEAAWRSVFSGSSVVTLATGTLLSALCLVLVAHAVGTMVRSRSPLVALDLVLAVAAVTAVWLMIVPLLANFAFGTAMTILKVAAFSVPVTIAIGGAWQLSRGRTDARRSHLELSRFFWIAMAAVLAALALYLAWVLSAGPGDLRNRAAIASPRGDWALVTGVAKGRNDFAPAFLMNTKNGRWTRATTLRWGGAEFTRRGDAAIVLSTRMSGFAVDPRAGVEVQMLDGTNRRIDTGTSVRLAGGNVILSDDLRRLAKFENHIVSVYDVSSKALLGSARLPFGDAVRMFFVSPDVVRVYGALPRSSEVHIYEFDAGTKRLQETGRIASNFFPIQVSADGSTAVVSIGRRTIVDGRTGAVRGTIAGVRRNFPATLLPDGRIALVDTTGIRLFDASGALVREIPMPASPGLVGGRVADLLGGDKLLVVLRRNNGPAGSDLSVVDVQSGAVERIERNTILRTQEWSVDPRIVDGKTTELVISDQEGTLWRWNPLTGAKAKIL